MSFKKDIRTLGVNAVTELNEVNAAIKDLESKKEGYYKPTYDKMMQELVDKRDTLITGTQRKAKELAEAYKKDKAASLAPKGAELTEDAALLTSGLNLTAAELEALFDKHKGNATMQRLVSEYANKNEIAISRVATTAKDYNEAADNMLGYINSALQRPEYADIFNSDDYFNQITPACMNED